MVTYSYSTHGGGSRFPNESAASHRARRRAAGRSSGSSNAFISQQEIQEEKQQQLKQATQKEGKQNTLSVASQLAKSGVVTTTQSEINIYNQDTGAYVGSTKQTYYQYGRSRGSSERTSYVDPNRTGTFKGQPARFEGGTYTQINVPKRSLGAALVAEGLSKLPTDKKYDPSQVDSYSNSLRDQEHAERGFAKFIDKGARNDKVGGVYSFPQKVGRFGAKSVYNFGSGVVGFAQRVTINPSRQFRERPVESVSGTLAIGSFVAGQTYNWATTPTKQFIAGSATKTKVSGVVIQSNKGKDLVNRAFEAVGDPAPFKPTATAFKGTQVGKDGAFTFTRSSTFPKGKAPTQHQTASYEVFARNTDSGRYAYNVGISRDTTVKGSGFNVFEQASVSTKSGTYLTGGSYGTGRGIVPQDANRYSGLITSRGTGSGGSSGSNLKLQNYNQIIDVVPQQTTAASGFIPSPLLKQTSETSLKVNYNTEIKTKPTNIFVGQSRQELISPVSNFQPFQDTKTGSKVISIGKARGSSKGSLYQEQVQIQEPIHDNIIIDQIQDPIQEQKQRTIQKQQYSWGQGYVFNIPPNVPPRIPIIPSGFVPFGGSGGSYGTGNFFGKQKKGYTPSAFSLATGFKGKSSVEGIKTGLGVRPIQTKSKKKKRKGKR